MTQQLSFLDAVAERSSKPRWAGKDITIRRHGGNSESTAAHERIAPTKAAVREGIYWMAFGRGDWGITADEAAIAFDCSHNHVAPRISELKAMGRLVPTDRTRKTRSGCSARVLVAR